MKRDAAGTWVMFDRIARRYDLLNRVLSFGCDAAWRRTLARALADRPDQRVLDLATGTGDVLLAVARYARGTRFGVGVDMAREMLALGKRKLAREGLETVFTLVAGNAMNLAFEEKSFDAVTIAFGIRNVADVLAGFREMWRVLKPGGRVLVLEFSLPANRIVRAVYLLYFRHVLPRLGAWISRDPQAYRYLNQSVEAFPHGKVLCDLMSEAGFTNLRMAPLTFGVATLYMGERA